MKIASPVWQGRISPVFDSSRRILLLEVDAGRVLARSEAPIGGELPLLTSVYCMSAPTAFPLA